MMDRSTETGRAARERPDGWWYPYIFVVFMAGVFVVNGDGLFRPRHLQRS